MYTFLFQDIFISFVNKFIEKHLWHFFKKEKIFLFKINLPIQNKLP